MRVASSPNPNVPFLPAGTAANDTTLCLSALPRLGPECSNSSSCLSPASSIEFSHLVQILFQNATSNVFPLPHSGKLISIRIGAACRPVETVVRQAAVAAGLFRHQTRSSCCWCKTIMKINCFLLLSAVQPGCTAQHLFSSVRTVTVIVHPPRAAPDQRGAPVTEIIVLVSVSTLPPRPGPPPTSATAALPPSGGGAGKVAAPTARISPATARGYRCLI